VSEAVSAEASQLLSGRLLARNSIWNLLGLGLPLGVAVAVIPALVGILGTERFGLLTLGWALVGYFSLFDLGLGRALTKLVAERIAKGEVTDLPVLIGTGLVLLTGLGLVACLALLAAVPILVESVLAVPPALRGEASTSFSVLALGLPVVILSSALIGILEAQQRFRAINLVRIPAGVLTYLGPLLATLVAPNLVAATLALVLVRVASTALYLWSCRSALPRGRAVFRRGHVRPLVAFGAWVTVSNIIGPLMVYFDRFVVGAMVSLAAVAYYATPYEVVTRSWVLPTAVSAVLFPALTMAVTTDHRRLERLFGAAIDVIVLTMAIPLALVVLFAPEGLHAWLGAGWAEQSAPVLRWLSLGVFINSVARVPSALIQGVGRPDLTAKLHVLELAPYGAALILLLSTFGIAGAAAAWTMRIVVDTAALFWLAVWLAPALRGVAQSAVLKTVAAVIAMAAAAVPGDPWLKVGYVVLLGLIGGWLIWDARHRMTASIPRAEWLRSDR
jgi:O-antigen/teichoic acid export membrane protein